MDRRAFLSHAGLLTLGNWMAMTAAAPPVAAKTARSADRNEDRDHALAPVTLFLCGDVMTGRGIDQVLPTHVDPMLFESYVRSAQTYVELAERANGPIARPVDAIYIWGDALGELDRASPAARIINLETAVTTSAEPWPGKGIHYRMHPDNVSCLTAAGIDCCVLANNHVLDWGYRGLEETLETLNEAGIASAGAGSNLAAARLPAVIATGAGARVLVFAYGSPTSGIPREWQAGRNRAGLNLLEDVSDRSIARIAAEIAATKTHGDVVVASIHWGTNWGYRIPRWQRAFAQRLIDTAGIDVIHGHSSHHPRAIEVYRDKLILYGCGDFLNDYEGIGGREEYRGDLCLMYFPHIDPVTGRLTELRMVPMQIRNFRLNRASEADADWLRTTLAREGRKFDTDVILGTDATLTLRWPATALPQPSRDSP